MSRFRINGYPEFTIQIAYYIGQLILIPLSLIMKIVIWDKWTTYLLEIELHCILSLISLHWPGWMEVEVPEIRQLHKYIHITNNYSTRTRLHLYGVGAPRWYLLVNAFGMTMRTQNNQIQRIQRNESGVERAWSGFRTTRIRSQLTTSIVIEMSGTGNSGTIGKMDQLIKSIPYPSNEICNLISVHTV
jgi:hypothetical protein